MRAPAIILTADGLILTNNHVVEGATDLEVRFNDGTTATATVVGTTATDDLAVIKADGVSGLTPATLGSSADLAGRPAGRGDRLAARPLRHRHLRHRLRAQPSGPHLRRGDGQRRSRRTP